ncbi:MAG: GDSL-type esterase/lipase family protein, partial [Planctomycetota bacterium]
EGGIVPVYTKDCKILNNTIHEKNSRQGRLIRIVFDNDGLFVANNLISGPKIRNESKSEIKFVNNVVKDLTDAFVNPDRGNLHLKRRVSEITDRSVKVAEITTDIDNQPRDAKPDIGADELLAIRR